MPPCDGADSGVATRGAMVQVGAACGVGVGSEQRKGARVGGELRRSKGRAPWWMA